MRKLLVVVCGVALTVAPLHAQTAQTDSHLRDFRDKLIWKGPLVKTAIKALLEEALNTPREWGRGPDGFAKRAGNAFAQRTVKSTVELGVSTWTHEDLHFQRSGEGGFWTRARHAALGALWVRRDNGPGHTLAAGRISGAFAAGELSRTWMPPRVATFGAGMRTFGGIIGLDVGTDLVREFWPRKR